MLLVAGAAASDSFRLQVVFTADTSTTLCPPGSSLICGNFRAKGSRTSADVALGLIVLTVSTSPPNLAIVVGGRRPLAERPSGKLKPLPIGTVRDAVTVVPDSRINRSPVAPMLAATKTPSPIACACGRAPEAPVRKLTGGPGLPCEVTGAVQKRSPVTSIQTAWSAPLLRATNCGTRMV